MPLDFFDFFSGCGGTSRGMQEAGIAIRFGLDVDPDAKRTYEANFPKATFVCRDIRDVSTEDVAAYIKRRHGRPLVFGACAPCQPFSRHNSVSDKADERRDLLGEFDRFVKTYLPEYIFLENVPGLQSVEKRKGPYTQFKALLHELDYFFDQKVVMAYHYGVPQSRRRLILLGSRIAPISLPTRTHGLGTDHPDLPTVREWISHLPPIKAGEAHRDIANHRAANLSPMNLMRITATPQGGNRTDWPKGLGLPCHQTHSGHTDVYGRMPLDAPSAALTTRCISLSNGRFGHPIQDRAISVREAACIQTFPMDFRFYGNLASMARQIGNAVPVAMAKIFGQSIITHYARHKNLQAVRAA
jgi:DNA (cytosine-5)-methyltransferase 1